MPRHSNSIQQRSTPWIPMHLLLLALPAALQAQFFYVTNNGAITITAYTGPGGAVTIPDTIDGFAVTSIGNLAFYRSASLTSVTIPNSVTNIGYQAFLSCTSLTSVTIPDGVRSIEFGAFDDCSSLTNVAIGNGVRSIASWAFAGCTNLTRIIIPDGVTSIGGQAFSYCSSLTNVIIGSRVTKMDRAFYDCTSLTAIMVDALNPVYSSLDGVLFDKSQTRLIQYPAAKAGSYAPPTSVTSIGDRAFLECTRLTNITLPNSVTSIGNEAFESCTSLSSVSIGSGVTTIGEYAFFFCSSLTSITIPNSVTNIGDGAFNSCFNLANVSIGSGLSSIGDGTFDSCFNLRSVTIPNNVISIGDRAFNSCTSLSSVSIGSGVTSIGDAAFFYCSSLINITIPNSVTSIGGAAFGGCSSLTSITIPNSVTNIGDGAFEFCTGLSSITIPDSVTNIRGYAFYYCTNLTAVYFQGNAPVLGSDVFDGDDNATVYYLPDTAGWGATFGGRPTVLLRRPVADASRTPLIVISANGIDATVVLDGSRSFDPAGGPLQYAWYEVGNPTALAVGAVSAVVLPVGAHSLLLVVSDGILSATNAFTVEVITTAQAVERLIAQVESALPHSRPLVATLSAALASVERNNTVAAISHLLAFQNQVRALVSPRDAALAEDFIQHAQEIITVLSGSINRGGPHGRFKGGGASANQAIESEL